MPRWLAPIIILVSCFAAYLASIRYVGSVQHLAPRSFTSQLLPTSSLPQICFIFLTGKGVLNPGLWQRWYEDARIRLSELGIEPLADKGKLLECPVKQSRYLKAVVSWSPNSTLEEVTTSLPCWMRDGIMPKPTQGRWGSTNNVLHAAMAYANEVYPSADQYVIVSDRSIPTKRFLSILGEVAVDRRSRFYLWLMDFYQGYPKIAEWFTVSPAHLKILVENPLLWLGKNSLPSDSKKYKKGYGTEEEYWPLRVILDFEDVTPPPTEKERLASTWLEPYIKPYLQHTPDFKSLHWVHWYEIDARNRRIFLGESDNSTQRPMTFTKVNAGLLKYLVEQEGVWMMRKVTKETIVEHCGMTQMDYVTSWLRINAGDGNPFLVNEETRQQIAGNATERLARTCTVEEFMAKTLLLKSANQTLNHEESGEPWLYYGDRPLPKI